MFFRRLPIESMVGWFLAGMSATLSYDHRHSDFTAATFQLNTGYSFLSNSILLSLSAAQAWPMDRTSTSRYSC